MAYIYSAPDLIHTAENGTTTQFQFHKYGEVVLGLTGDAVTAYEANFSPILSALQALVDAGTLVIDLSPAGSVTKATTYTFTTNPVPDEDWFDTKVLDGSTSEEFWNVIAGDPAITVPTRVWLDRS